MKEHPAVVVVGGGISGLSTAFWLSRYGIAATVLERSAVPGGTMHTRMFDGWMVEAGPNSALETTPLIGLMLDGVGLTADRVYADPASDKRYILRGDRLHVLPMKPGAFFSSDLWTTAGKLRLLKEPFVGRAGEEETVAQFVTRRLGQEFLDYAINPFVAGVYAGNPEQLSVRAAFPKLYALEEKYGGLIKGMIRGARERKKRAEKAKDRARLFSFTSGMQMFPDAVAKHLGSQFRAGATVHDIRCNEGTAAPRFKVTVTAEGASLTLNADAVIVSTPSFAAGPLVRGILPDLCDKLEHIYYPPVAEVVLGYRREDIGHTLDGFGYLIPAKEQRKILGTIWSSSLFRNRAPEGHVALTSFVGGARQPQLLDLDDDGLIDVTHEEIVSLLQAKALPLFSRVIRWQHAIPQYNLGYGTTTDAIDNAEARFAGLFFCANYRRGIAVGDCVMNGERIAARVAAMFGNAPQRPEGVSD